MPANPPTPARWRRSRAVPRNPLRRTSFAAFAALFVSALGAPVAVADDSRYEDTSADGSVVFFTTTDPLVNGDTDARRDVFARSFEAAVGEYVTRLVSIGPIGGNQAYDATFSAASGDGSKVFFSTPERLVPTDEDTVSDLYMRDLAANTTTLVSRADAACSGSCGNSNQASDGVAGASLAAAGNRAFFASKEKLSHLDGDSETDIYMRDLSGPETTVLVSCGDGPCTSSGFGNGSLPVALRDVSDDGETAYLSSSEGLVASDEDGATDIYVRDLVAQTTELVSIAGVCPLPPAEQSQCNPVFGGTSNDGLHAFFQTRERLSVADTDEAADIYDWSAGTASLASTGPDGGNGPLNHATYAGSSTDGESVFFKTDEQLVTPDDADAVRDVYVRRGGTVTDLVSTGSQSGVSSDAEMDPALGAIGQGAGLLAVFVTEEALVSDDEDTKQDVYLRDLSAETTELVSRGSADCAPACGNGEEVNANANIAAASADGAHLLFVTGERLANADGDTVQDVYERSAAGTALVSRGPLGGSGAFPTKQMAIAADGSKAFFETSERLTPDDDFLEEDDVYGRSEGETLLVSQGNDPELELGPPAPTLQGTDPASPGQSTSPKVLGQAVGTEVKLYTNASCSGEQPLDPSGEPAGGSGEELASGGIAVAVAAGTTVTFYATAEAEGIVSSCSNGVTYKQETPPPPPPPPPPPGPEGGSGGGGTAAGGTSSGPGSGATGGQPKTHSGGIAFLTPETRITFGPAFKTRKRKVVFRFVDATGQPGTRFICRLDRRKWRSCGSPMRLAKLTRGKHVFKVKAENAVGTWEAQPTKRSFKVVRR
jgi:hypothetical protein